jgi:tRNA (guanine26-N2/guanine27-N2)-dimethyltransferase
MYEIVREGNAVVRIKKADKISKEMEVFYNPVMKLNRDISVLLLNSIDNIDMQIALPLAGSGIRGIRFLKELKKNKIKSISFNDYSIKAVNSVKNSLRLNGINNFTFKENSINNLYNNKKYNNEKNNFKNRKIIISNGDANLFLLNSTGFDYIDIDPFGTSNFYLDSAIKRISRNGILAVTNTDTAALTGTYPKACVRKYWSTPKRDYMMHETGLRILIRKIQLVGMQYEKALFPIFSYFKDHYFRICFQCIKGKRLCDEIASEHGMFNDAGPLWIGNLWDSKLVSKMHSALLKDTIGNKSLKINSIKNKIIKNNNSMSKINNVINNNELMMFLRTIKEESKINAVGFYDVHQMAKNKKLKTIIKKAELIKKIRKNSFKASNTHFSGTGIRTNIDYKGFLKLLKE